jgi:hypothetical protein
MKKSRASKLTSNILRDCDKLCLVVSEDPGLKGYCLLLKCNGSNLRSPALTVKCEVIIGFR